MRLALCSPGEVWGGVEQFVESLARFFWNGGLPIVTIVFADGPLRQRLDAAGIPVVVVTGRGKYDPTSILQLGKVLREHRCTVLHTHGYKSAVIGGLAARSNGVRHVRTEHGRVEPWSGAARIKMHANAVLERAATRWLTDALVFVSQDIRQRSSNAQITVLQKVIRNGIEPPQTALPIPSSEVLGGSSDVIKLGIVGRLAPIKGHIHLFQAMSSLRHVRCHLFVIGSGPLDDEYRRFCDDHDLNEMVTFVGFKPNIHDYLRQLDILAMPSLYEGMPYTLLEAMYHKVPIVASDVGGLAEVLTNGETGLLVPPGNSAALAQAVERLVSSPTERKTLAENAFRRVSEEFLIGQMADQYLDVYRRVLTE